MLELENVESLYWLHSLTTVSISIVPSWPPHIQTSHCLHSPTTWVCPSFKKSTLISDPYLDLLLEFF